MTARGSAPGVRQSEPVEDPRLLGVSSAALPPGTRLSTIPEEAFYCVECGADGLDCPDHGEFALKADRVRQSECSRGCPEYVVRCAHYDGDDRVVWLADVRAYNKATCGRWAHAVPGPRLMVIIGTPERLPWLGCDCLRQSPILPEVETDSRAEADAAFARFEAQLLGREEAS